MRGLIMYYTSFVLVSAGIVGRAGWLTLRSGRYPYPGQWALIPVSRNPWWVGFNAAAYLCVAVGLLGGIGYLWIDLDIASLFISVQDTAT
ncbi:hypothetical protein E1B00_13965 [Arenimonas terrae]|uniref:Uncharacterized protein n=2 Tax=Arenimonas terrae TaxID=2546226 RepID=A0A5C4RNI4_9GAMM|nr:hypothetical protein E1B00_13965 [Arenimonas terrae]